MNPLLFYSLWVLALSLKAIGAAWDASFHFKYFRELTQAPHVVNIIGFVLAFFLYYWMHRDRSLKEHKAWPRRLIGLSFLIYFIGIILDELYHRLYGIDLTTWSPTHFIFYISTFMLAVGILFYFIRDPRTKRFSPNLRTFFLLLFGVFLLEDVWFPLIQQEQGVLAIYYFMIGQPSASAELLAKMGDITSKAYGAISSWVYPVYGAFMAVFVFRFMKGFVPILFSSTSIAALFIFFRVGMYSIFSLVHYPTSTIPYFLILIGFACDILFALRGKKNELVFSVLLALVTGICFFTPYLILSEIPQIPLVTPFMYLPIVLAAWLALWLAVWSTRLLKNHEY